MIKRKMTLLDCVVIGLTVMGLSMPIYIIGTSSPEKAKQREEKISRLQGLVSNVLEKASMEDGQRGFSFQEGAEMAYVLGDTRMIYEGQTIRLYVAERQKYKIFEQSPAGDNPGIFLKIGEGRDYVEIPEERLKAYLEEGGRG